MTEPLKPVRHDTRDSSSPPLTASELFATIEAWREADRRRFSCPVQAAPMVRWTRPTFVDLYDEPLRRAWLAGQAGYFA